MNAWKNQLREARDLTEKTILEMRRLIAALSPAVLEQLGLAAALRQLAARFRSLHPCRVRLKLSNLADLPQQTGTITYRLVQECFNNIGKHAGASEINVAVGVSGDRMRLRIEDNGSGFQAAEALTRGDSFGLSGMRERVALLDGKFQIQSSMQGPKTGTKISIELPISKSEPASRTEAGRRLLHPGRRPPAQFGGQISQAGEPRKVNTNVENANHAGGRSHAVPPRHQDFNLGRG